MSSCVRRPISSNATTVLTGGSFEAIASFSIRFSRCLGIRGRNAPLLSTSALARAALVACWIVLAAVSREVTNLRGAGVELLSLVIKVLYGPFVF